MEILYLRRRGKVNSVGQPSIRGISFENTALFRKVEAIREGLEEGFLITDRLEIVNRFSLQWFGDYLYAFFQLLIGQETFSHYKSHRVMNALTQFCLEHSELYISSEANLNKLQESIRKITEIFRTKTRGKYSFAKIDPFLSFIPPSPKWPIKEENKPFLSLSSSTKIKLGKILKTYALYQALGKELQIFFKKEKRQGQGGELVVNRAIVLFDPEKGRNLIAIQNLKQSILFVGASQKNSPPHIILCSNVRTGRKIDPIIVKVCHDLTSGNTMIRTTHHEPSFNKKVRSLPFRAQHFFENVIAWVPIYRLKHGEDKLYSDIRRYPDFPSRNREPSKIYLVQKMENGDLALFFGINQRRLLSYHTIFSAFSLHAASKEFHDIEMRWSRRMNLSANPEENVVNDLIGFCERFSEIFVSREEPWYLIKQKVSALKSSLKIKTSQQYRTLFSKLDKMFSFKPPEISWPSNHPEEINGEALSLSSIFPFMREVKKARELELDLKRVIRKYFFYQYIESPVRLFFFKSKKGAKVERTLLLEKVDSNDPSSNQLLDKIEDLPCSILFATDVDEKPYILLCSKASQISDLNREFFKRKVRKCFDLLSGKWFVRKKTTPTETITLQSICEMKKYKKKCLEPFTAIVQTSRKKLDDSTEQKKYNEIRTLPVSVSQKTSKVFLVEPMYAGNLQDLIESGQLTTPKKVDIAYNLLRALCFLHEMKAERIISSNKKVSSPFCHGDIHPGNILIEKVGASSYLPILSDYQYATDMHRFFPNPHWGSAVAGAVQKLREEPTDPRYQSYLHRFYELYGQGEDVWMLGQVLLSLVLEEVSFLGSCLVFLSSPNVNNPAYVQRIANELQSMKNNFVLRDSYFESEQESYDQTIRQKKEQKSLDPILKDMIDQVISRMLRANPVTRITLKDAIKKMETIKDKYNK